MILVQDLYVNLKVDLKGKLKSHHCDITQILFHTLLLSPTNVTNGNYNLKRFFM